VTELATARPAAQLDDRLFIACGLSWAAGLIHVRAAFDHIDEYALYAVFFALLAPAQFAWGTALYRRASRRLLYAGAGMSLLVAALWIVSRTSGLPIGPTPWRPEAVGPIDSLCTADEVVLAALALLQLRPGGRGPGRRLLAAAGIGLILLSSVVLVMAGHAHAH